MTATREGWYRRGGKRALDLSLALAGLIVLSPLFALVALVVLLTLGAPVLFRQQRPGLGGAPFTIVKFRTMRELTKRSGDSREDEQRLTRAGRFLRAASLDEMPELWNVIRGDMSLVGPRPIVTAEIVKYGPGSRVGRRSRGGTCSPGRRSSSATSGTSTTSASVSICASSGPR